MMISASEMKKIIELMTNCLSKIDFKTAMDAAQHTKQPVAWTFKVLKAFVKYSGL